MIVKVCGMRQPENIRAVEQAGADWIGLICYDRSPRFVSSVPSYLPQHSKRIGVLSMKIMQALHIVHTS